MKDRGCMKLKDKTVVMQDWLALDSAEKEMEGSKRGVKPEEPEKEEKTQSSPWTLISSLLFSSLLSSVLLTSIFCLWFL